MDDLAEYFNRAVSERLQARSRSVISYAVKRRARSTRYDTLASSLASAPARAVPEPSTSASIGAIVETDLAGRRTLVAQLEQHVVAVLSPAVTALQGSRNGDGLVIAFRMLLRRGSLNLYGPDQSCRDTSSKRVPTIERANVKASTCADSVARRRHSFTRRRGRAA